MDYDVICIIGTDREEHPHKPTSEETLVVVHGMVDDLETQGYVVRRLQCVLDHPDGTVAIVESNLVET